MKKLFFISLLFGTIACAPGTVPNTGTQSATIASPEAEAKALTTKMTSVLSLDAAQEEKILMINVVNTKVIKRLRESNDTAKLSTTKEKYHNELKEVLNENQFAKFLVEFKEL